MGGGHFYFRDTIVTSACWKTQKECAVKDPLVGRKVESEGLRFLAMLLQHRSTNTPPSCAVLATGDIAPEQNYLLWFAVSGFLLVLS